MLTIKNFYKRVWQEYADPHYHPITAEALKTQARVVRARIKKERPQMVLDLGCGPAPVIKPHWAPMVVSADIIPEMLQHLKQKDCHEAVCLDARRLPFKARAFDLIWCGLLVDHIHEVSQWIEELMTVLDKAGVLGFASWQRSCVPPDRYPHGRMCFTMATGEELSVPSYPNCDEALALLGELDPDMRVRDYPIIPNQYVLQIAWARIHKD